MQYTKNIYYIDNKGEIIYYTNSILEKINYTCVI